MAISVWFPADVGRIIAGIHRAHTDSLNAAGMCSGNTAEYQRGYDDALCAVAVAFGLSTPGESGRGAVTHARRIGREVDNT